MKTNQNQLQQGDVMLSLVSKVPSGCKKITDQRGVVLAEGEVTGHYHSLNDGGVELLEAPTGQRYVVNSGKKPATLTHQEHKPITVPPGAFAIGIVREKDWFADMVRPVRD